jgi:hypothetical protein
MVGLFAGKSILRVLPPYYACVKELLTDHGQAPNKGANVNGILRERYANVTVILIQHKEAARWNNGTIMIASDIT